MTEDPTPRHEDEGPVAATLDDQAAPGATRTRRDSGSERHRGGLWHAVREFVIVVALALVLSLAVKSWLMQAFFIPSSSMEDTLHVGDRVVVSKLTPGVDKLQRGDIVVFEDKAQWLPPAPETQRSGLSGVVHDGLVFVGLLPNDSDNHLIKRVIGLPGDKVVCCSTDGRLTVNGTPVTEPYLKPGDAPSTEKFTITVPQDKVWVMGDHRSDSADSRYHDPTRDGASGSVPVDDVVGRAVGVVWPLSDMTWLSRPSDTFATVPAKP